MNNLKLFFNIVEEIVCIKRENIGNLVKKVNSNK